MTPTRALPLALLLVAACTIDPGPSAAVRSGVFRYTARSVSGEPLLTGKIELDCLEDSTVTGRWTIAWLPGADSTAPVGPQVGSGELAGTRVGDTLRLQLNPNNADHNVDLEATRGGSGYTGRWQWVTFTGPRAAGPFSAVLR